MSAWKIGCKAAKRLGIGIVRSVKISSYPSISNQLVVDTMIVASFAVQIRYEPIKLPAIRTEPYEIEDQNQA